VDTERRDAEKENGRQKEREREREREKEREYVCVISRDCNVQYGHAYSENETMITRESSTRILKGNSAYDRKKRSHGS
jgi:hypothetical protein